VAETGATQSIHQISRSRLENDANPDLIESFNGRLRDELLNETLFTSLAHAQQMLAAFQDDANFAAHVR